MLTSTGPSVVPTVVPQPSLVRPDPEVPARAGRRQFTAAYKLRILQEAAHCTSGQLGALLRREGLYSSHLGNWRRQRARGALAAFIPSRRNPEINEVAFARVREDKLRESGDGFDGTWVAHPDLVPVATEVFDQVLGTRPNQLEKQRPEVQVRAKDLLDARVPGGEVTEAGLRNNISVGIQYLESWLRGVGAAAIFNLMEDTATAEISRSQVWQWQRHGVQLREGPQVAPDLVRRLEAEELEKIRVAIGDELYARGQFPRATELFEQVALSDQFVEFLTFPAYDALD